MSVPSRAMRNLARRKVRTASVSLIMGLSIALFLSLSVLNTGITNLNNNLNATANNLLSQVDDVITVQVAGSQGFLSQKTVNASEVPLVAATPHVQSVQRMLLHFDRTGGGNRSQGFALVEGIDVNGPISVYFSGDVNITSGSDLTPSDANATDAIVGTQYASQTGSGVGSTINLNGTSFTVVGEYTTGTSFGDNGIVAPFAPLAKALNVTGANLLYVTADSVANVNTVVSKLRSELGSYYDVSALSSTEGAFISLAVGSITSEGNSIESTSELGAESSLAVGAAVMVFVMVMVASERTREIGLLKALGFRNGKIVAQLLLESLLLSAIGFAVGVLLASWLGPTIDQRVLNQGSATGLAAFARGYFGTFSFSLGLQTLLLGAAVTVGLGLLGSLYPVVRAIRLKPSEALRYE